eukprot:COSAG04_NODE_1336_length_7177_cov_9.968776_5_plen_268_part_00
MTRVPLNNSESPITTLSPQPAQPACRHLQSSSRICATDADRLVSGAPVARRRSAGRRRRRRRSGWARRAARGRRACTPRSPPSRCCRGATPRVFSAAISESQASGEGRGGGGAHPLGDVEGRGVGRHPDRLDVHHVLDLVHHAADRRGVLVHHLRSSAGASQRGWLVGWGRAGAGARLGVEEALRPEAERLHRGPRLAQPPTSSARREAARAAAAAAPARGGGSEPWRSCPACRGGARRGGSRSSSCGRPSLRPGRLVGPSEPVMPR